MTDQIADTASPWASWPLDREIVMSRLVDADRQTAWRAWVEPEQIVQWFGPAGFGIKTHEIDIRAGGRWRFDMIAPDGTVFSNRMAFLRLEPPRLIEFIHCSDIENDPDAFRMLVTFDQQDNGKTVISLRQMHPNPQRRAIAIGFGAVELGGQTWGKFADHVARMAAGAA